MSNPPDDSTDCEMIPPRQMVDVSFIVESTHDSVILTIAVDSNEDDVEILLNPQSSRALGELLFKSSYDAERPDAPV